MRHPDRPDLAAARRKLAERYGPAGAAPASQEPGDRGAADEVLRADRYGPAGAGPASQGLRDRGAVDEVLRAVHAAPDEILAALAIVTELRADLDRTERQLVTRAREQRVSWQRVAEASGLGSRQAAEQRWLRLRAAPGREPAGGRRQRDIDKVLGVASLRDRVAELHDQLARLPDQPGRPPALVRLARRTLAEAVAAPAGPLYDLARLAVADLREVPAGALDHGQSASLEEVSVALASRGGQPERGRLKNALTRRATDARLS